MVNTEIMEKHITIGIAGHVDHGKTALVRCLTGIDTDRLREEKRRGLSIESGIAPLKLLSGIQIALVDWNTLKYLTSSRPKPVSLY